MTQHILIQNNKLLINCIYIYIYAWEFQNIIVKFIYVSRCFKSLIKHFPVVFFFKTFF